MDKLFEKVSTQRISFNKKELNELKSYYETWSWDLENYANKKFVIKNI